jgi:hypothetical protein
MSVTRPLEGPRGSEGALEGPPEEFLGLGGSKETPGGGGSLEASAMVLLAMFSVLSHCN